MDIQDNTNNSSKDVASAIKDYSQRSLGNVKILMIEDDQFMADLVLSNLSKHGCIPYSGSTGEEAVSLAEEFKPDVIILDLMLPGRSGEEVLAELKKSESLKGIPVVVFTNSDNEETMKNVLALGAAEYLPKSSVEVPKLAELIFNIKKKAADTQPQA